MNTHRLVDERIILTSRGTLFSGPGGQFRGCLVRCCLLCLACIVLATFPGCVIIPTPEHDLLAGRGEIDESDIAFLEVGKTTREDVLLRFGEPDMVLDEECILAYYWMVSHGYWFVGGYYSGTGGVIPKNYVFMLEFDEEGRLKRFERSGSIFSAAQTRLEKWTPRDGEKTVREIIMIDPMPEVPAQPSILGTPTPPVRFWVGEFRQLRTDPNAGTLIGHKKAAFGVIVADVRTTRPVIDMVRTSVTAQLEAAGHHLVDRDPDVMVTGEIAEFGVTTSINLATWDAIGSLDVILEVQPVTGTGAKIPRRYQAKHASGTLLGPSKAHFERVMRTCLEDMQRQMASDAELARLLGGKRP
jgi:outer membrane protein assembly factor BamE (lipoprotein component of BamABCDE complex)